ncbi:MAG: SWIM zinc finger family protein [Immundisolibacter sp.]|uniref:SWIM zinc finger family protein n=1 Tax=Immundisolibacter sp. TaxID=1934948 RepID=UPI003EE37043
MLSDADLERLAGKAACERGRGYYREGRVHLTAVAADALEGEAHGTETYRLWLRCDGGAWRWDCECPAADSGALCKHLVAAVLIARDGAPDDAPPDDESDQAPRKASAVRAREDLRAFLHSQPARRLADWLAALADADPEVDKRLRLQRAVQQPGALKEALAKLLNTGFLDYRASLRYADRLGAAVAVLEGRLGEDPGQCRELCEYALGRLFKIYERADDSAGAIGERMGEIAALHARACAAMPPGKALARPLHVLQRKDGWDMIRLTDYWQALGAAGQADYGRLIGAELARLPAAPSDESRWGEAFAIRSRAQAYARCAGDFELLQRVLRWDLSEPHDHLRVLESLREFGQEREALAWAEHAVKRFPRDERLRAALADCLHAAGLDEEALDQCWERFRLVSSGASWDDLKRAAGEQWPQWRGRALDTIKAGEGQAATLRVGLLQHDGDLAGAAALARERPVWPQALFHLARSLERDDPATAGMFYLRLAEEQARQLGSAQQYPTLVIYLKRASGVLPVERWQPAVAAVRAAHGKKTKLLSLLDEAGL